MPTSASLEPGLRWWRRANWLALALPLVVADTLGLTPHPVPVFLLAVSVIAVFLAPAACARIAPFACFAYGGYGLFLFHSLSLFEANPVIYGVVHSGVSDNVAYVLPQAIAFLVLGAGLLALGDAPGSAAVRRAVAQLRGADGQPKAVPPLLLLPVAFLWEELFSSWLWFAWDSSWRLLAILLLAASAGVVVRFPRQAAGLAVAGLLVFGLYGVLDGLAHLWFAGPPAFSPATDYQAKPLPWLDGAVPLNFGIPGLLAVIQGAALLWLGVRLVPRLDWTGERELARQAQVLTRRVDRLTRTRSDATETAVTELRRIERDLHDGAQARLVAVGMSLRAAEQLMDENPQAARALMAEARETSSRALNDLRDLVRGIYPPVLADRGLADAVRALALDAPLPVDVDVDLPAEPPMPVAAAVYFGIAEALTNAARHAGAHTVQVSVTYSGGLLRATVSDDGTGGADPARGSGLAGVERRLATFDGILAVSSPAGGPTLVVLEVPCTLSGAGEPGAAMPGRAE